MKAELRPTSEMKDSGVQWLGQIPNNWDIIRFKFVHVGANVGMSIDREYWSDDDADTAFYTAQINPIHVRYNGFPEWKYTSANDLLLARNATPYVYLPVIKAAYTDHIIRVDLKSNFDRRYIRYCLQQSIIFDVAEGVSLPTWSVQIWNRQIVPFISLKEQQAIADYLDDRCSKIDEIIAEATASIEEYKKLKQAVIFEAVTKGLDKNVTMKGSEILWAKQIPDSWDVVKVAWLYSVELGKMLDGKRITGVRLKPYLRNADVQWNVINTNNLPEMDFTEDDDERYSVKSGDLLVCEGGDIGKSFIVPEDFPKGIYYQKALHRVRAFDGDIDSLKWLRYILYVMSKYSFFNVLSGEKATIQHLPGVTFNQLRFPMPKQGEKESIIKFLDNKIPEYDILISEKQSLIEDLQSYKKSLIYEVVTGKRRVV